MQSTRYRLQAQAAVPAGGGAPYHRRPYTYTHAHACVRAYAHARVCMQVHVRMCMCTDTRVHSVCMHCAHMHLHVRMHSDRENGRVGDPIHEDVCHSITPRLNCLLTQPLAHQRKGRVGDPIHEDACRELGIQRQRHHAARLRVRTWMHARMCTYMGACTYVYAQGHAHAYVRTWMRACMCGLADACTCLYVYWLSGAWMQVYGGACKLLHVP